MELKLRSQMEHDGMTGLLNPGGVYRQFPEFSATALPQAPLP